VNELEGSRALWNRTRLDLRSDEILAQILDRGHMDDWRALYRLACKDAQLRDRIHRIVLSVPVPLPHFWLAALRRAGADVNLGAETPSYDSGL
jgi:hypothetical protein